MTGWQSLRAAGLALRARHFSEYADPRAAQERLLRGILNALVGSQFAKDHSLDPGMTLAEFRAAIPIRNYEGYLPWITDLIAGNGNSLSAHPPLALELTGGSSGGRKPVPMNGVLLNGFRSGLVAWLGDLAETWPSICNGKTYFALSPALRVSPEPIGSWPLGLDSDLSYLGDDIAPHLAPSLLFIPEIAKLSTPNEWQTATLAMMLGTKDLSFISLWSPSFLTALLRALENNPEAILKVICDGGFGLAPNGGRARELGALSALSPEQIWPNLALVSVWSDASAAPYFNDLVQRTPHAAFQGKGLLATEGIFTIPFRAFADPVPAILSSLLEFCDSSGDCHFMWDLKVGETYDLIVTPIGGFVRYAIGDMVTCTGWAMPDVPMLRFVGRSGVNSDLVGEKLSEAFVLECLKAAGINGVLVANENVIPHYVLVSQSEISEHLTAKFEQELCCNPQYAYARTLGQLGPLRQHVDPDFISKLIERRLAGGHRLSDIKPPVLLSGVQSFDLPEFGV